MLPGAVEQGEAKEMKWPTAGGGEQLNTYIMSENLTRVKSILQTH